MIAIIGENIVDLLARADGSYKPHLGGSPFNLAIGIGRQKIPCAYLSPLSRDRFGNAFLDYLQKNHVDHVGTRSGYPSSIAIVTLDEMGQPHYSIYREKIADRDISAQHLIDSIPAGTRILHTGSLALEPEDMPRITQVLGEAKSRGIRISIDINMRVNFVSDKKSYREGIRNIIALCDYLKASDEDIVALYPEDDIKTTLEKLSQQMAHGLFAYTEGERGAHLMTGGRTLYRPVIRPEVFGDAVGAGDTFYATLLSFIAEHSIDRHPEKLADNHLLESALEHAVMAASINVSRHGCQPPDREELLFAMTKCQQAVL